jgi:ATPase subunit of ABC transporter with duplicated ATPase domains
VLLLDEPFAALDDEGKDTVHAALADFRGTLVIAAPGLADAPVDRVVELGRR